MSGGDVGQGGSGRERGRRQHPLPDVADRLDVGAGQQEGMAGGTQRGD